MALFNRRKDQTISDLEDYYANRNNRTGMAWLMAFLSLVITIGVIGALFFGGRWAYRALTDDNTTVITTTTNTGTVTGPDSITGVTDNTTDSSSDSGNSSAVEPEGVVSDSAVTTNDSNVSRVATTPTTGDSSLPDTGAGDILIIAPLVAAISGYLFSVRRFNK